MSVSALVAVLASRERERVRHEDQLARSKPDNYTLVEAAVFQQTLNRVKDYVNHERASALADVVASATAEIKTRNKWLPSFLRASTEPSAVAEKLSNVGADLADMLSTMAQSMIPGTYWEAVNRHTDLLKLVEAVSPSLIDTEIFGYPVVRVYTQDWDTCVIAANRGNPSTQTSTELGPSNGR
jgi:hypothetical protein